MGDRTLEKRRRPRRVRCESGGIQAVRGVFIARRGGCRVGARGRARCTLDPAQRSWCSAGGEFFFKKKILGAFLACVVGCLSCSPIGPEKAFAITVLLLSN